jgi:hypothetical protein
MISISGIEIRGESEIGPFWGGVSFGSGLQVLSAHNGYGKSLAVTGVAWCLGLEKMFGLQGNDIACFPLAARDGLNLGSAANVPVRSSEAILTIARSDGFGIRITRPIVGNPEAIVLEERASDGSVQRTSTFHAQSFTMKDDVGGFQNFLFRWLGLPREQAMTGLGTPSEIYLENLAPLFFIEQKEGWTDLQALQVYRYGIQQIADISVEYLLGALDALHDRFSKQTEAMREAGLKASLEALGDQIRATFQRRGWTVDWSSSGSPKDIAARWSKRKLTQVLEEDFEMSVEKEMGRLRERAAALRSLFGRENLDTANTSASSDASQAVVDLKAQRHQLREELHTTRSQVKEFTELAESLAHRIKASQDVLRFKREGIGRLDHVECPTCHRSLELSTFDLTSQSTSSVAAHIEALERDFSLTSANVETAEARAMRLSTEIALIERQLMDRERALATVNIAVGSAREQLAKAAADLSAVEGEIDRITVLAGELRQLQSSLETLTAQAAGPAETSAQQLDLSTRKSMFVSYLETFLRGLGHGGVMAEPGVPVTLDEHYIPYLGPRRLRSSGSASDHCRLIVAYVLALAETSIEKSGLHPGFTLLDEPFQQNPDDPHRDLFISFLVLD